MFDRMMFVSVSAATDEGDASGRPDYPRWRARCEVLEGRLRALAGEIAAAQAEFLGLLAEYDELEGWADWGVRSAAEWLSNHCGHGAYNARKEVALAHALESLPVLKESMTSGSMSLDKAAAVASLATPESETELVELALETTANQLAKVVAAARRALDPVSDNEDAAAQRRARTLQTWWDREGMLALRGRLPAEEGALFRQALEKAVDLNRRAAAGDGFDGDTVPAEGEEPEPVDPLADADDRAGAARADGLVLLGSSFLDAPPVAGGGDHYQVVIHVDVDTLVDDGEGRCHIEDGPALSVDVARRLCCGSSLVWLAEDRDGTPVAVSPKTQDIPASVRRAVRARDGGCVFPTGAGGTCGRAAAWSEVHHVEHRAHGGAHTTANCLTLCSFHHHLCHEGGFHVEIGPDGRPQFSRPDGTVIVNERPKLFGDGPPTRTPRHVKPDATWARSNGERMNLAAAVDAVLHMTGNIRAPQPFDDDELARHTDEMADDTPGEFYDPGYPPGYDPRHPRRSCDPGYSTDP